MNDQLRLRHAEPADYAAVAAVINDWWGGRNMRDMLPKLFFIHFRASSFVAEQDGQLVGFLCGFWSQTYPDEAYIHFVGVAPAARQLGLGRHLYERFFAAARDAGRPVVRCLTAPVNKGSIAFHTQMGFAIEPGTATLDGVPVAANYDGRGGDRVLFVKRLD